MKDIITVSISLFALALSLLTAYFSVLKKDDDLEAFVASPASVKMSEGGDQRSLKLYPSGRILFINAGNNPEAIFDVAIVVMQSEPGGASFKACDSEDHVDNDPHVTIVKLVSSNTVVKETEIFPFEAKLQEDPIESATMPTTVDNDGNISIRISSANIDAKRFGITTCYRIRVASMNYAKRLEDVYFPIETVSFAMKDGKFDKETSNIQNMWLPLPIVKRRAWAFWQ